MYDPARILIVDDHEANRDILAVRLSAHGYQIAEAADGEEAVTAAYRDRPDLILLDIMMPKLDGIEVCRRLKADESLSFMPIILVKLWRAYWRERADGGLLDRICSATTGQTCGPTQVGPLPGESRSGRRAWLRRSIGGEGIMRYRSLLLPAPALAGASAHGRARRSR